MSENLVRCWLHTASCHMIIHSGEPGFPGSPFFIGSRRSRTPRSGSNLDSEAGSLRGGRGQTDYRPFRKPGIKNLTSRPAATWRPRPRPAPPCRIFLTRMETALGGQHANGPSDRTSASSRPSLARVLARLELIEALLGLTRTVECTAVRFCLVERDPASLGRGRGWHGTARSLACRPSASPRTLGRTVEWLRSRFIPRRKLNTSTSWHGISSEVLRRLMLRVRLP